MENNRFKQLLDQFLNGDISDAGRVELDALLSGADAAELSRSLWQEDARMDPERKARMKAYMMGAVNTLPPVRKSRRNAWLTVAAVAAALAVGITGGIYLTRHALRVEEYVLSADNAQTSGITLPDGTVVRLNSSSKLTYDSAFNRRARTVTLSGEAFFDVASDPERPFVVRTGDMDVQAVGTQFNVRAYPTEEHVIATLVEGKVIVSSADERVMLSPRQEAVYARGTGQMSKREVAAAVALVPWMEGDLVFDNASLVHVAGVLERTFNVRTVIQDPSLKKRCYTGLVRNKSLKNVLELISSTSDVECQQIDDTIYFRKRR